ncbi:MAG: hypothetical protein ACREMX_14375 [Gemmatimonadales bacterium]
MMRPNRELTLWAGRLSLGLVAALALMGYYYGNIRFVPIAAGFAILAGVCYFGLQATSPSRTLANSGRHRAL